MPSPVLERFLRYVSYDTQSRRELATYPSTVRQLVLLRDLVDELAMGVADAAIDEHGYVMATIPATTSKADVPVDRVHRARGHLAGDERRGRQADRASQLRRAGPGAARRSRGRAARGRHRRIWRSGSATTS